MCVCVARLCDVVLSMVLANTWQHLFFMRTFSNLHMILLQVHPQMMKAVSGLAGMYMRLEVP